MIIWINGAFGAGKTQAAYELRRRAENAYVYDPENAGYFIRNNFPASACIGNFQDYPMWRMVNVEMLRYILEHHEGDVIVPMTITRREYYEEIIGRLSEEYDVKHVILSAEKKTLLRRLAFRMEGRRSWAAQQIDRCITAFDGNIPGHQITTDHMNINQVVEAIAAAVGISISADDRSVLRRWFDRCAVQCGSIRWPGSTF